MKPKLLDLFCKAGGAAMGYHRAGFDVVGVDNQPQPHYPFEFIQTDWEEPLHYLPGLWERDGIPYAVHASPPCQRYSTMTKKWNRQDSHPDLIVPVREALQALECVYDIENVATAPLINPVMLCGSMFGLGAVPEYHCDCGGIPFEYGLGKYGCPNCCGYGKAILQNKYQLRRHRLFESNIDIYAPASCNHQGQALPVYGHAGGKSKRDGLKFPGTDAWREGMGIDWMTGNELAEAIPPAYTEYIGGFLMKAVLDKSIRRV
jgi:DNA (cytosine-5)-methyltransferase 1